MRRCMGPESRLKGAPDGPAGASERAALGRKTVKPLLVLLSSFRGSGGSARLTSAAPGLWELLLFDPSCTAPG